MSVQEGVLESGAWKVTAGGALNVSIASSIGTGALVKGDNITSQGLYYVAPHSTAIVEAHTAAHATLPRIDQIVLEVLDATHDGGASNTVRTRIVDGTATAAATLDNRNGAAALPNNALRLADVLIPAAAVTVLAGNIRDRRQWARGAYSRIVRNANAAAGSDYTTTSATMVDIDATNLMMRLECSGLPVRFSLRGRMSNAGTNQLWGFAISVDSVTGVDGATSYMYGGHNSVAGGELPLDFIWDWIPAAGSHVIKPQWAVSGASASSLLARTTVPALFTVEEIIPQNANNT